MTYEDSWHAHELLLCLFNEWLRCLNFQVDCNFITYHGASFDDVIPGEAKIFATDFCLRAEGRTHIAETVSYFTEVFGVERDCLGNTFDREWPRELKACRLACDFFAFKAHRREFSYVEKVWAFKMFIALGDVCIDRLDVDRRFDSRVLEGFGKFDLSGEAVETSLYGGDDKVRDFKASGFPGGGPGGRLSGGR